MMLVYPGIPRFRSMARDFHDLNVAQYWGFFRAQDLRKNFGRLLMIDVDFGRKCSLRCPSCFRKHNPVDDERYADLTYSELLSTIMDAQDIGLREVKICGAGEPLENDLLMQFAEDLTERDIGLSVFTKGHVFGDDEWVAKLYGRYGIFDGKTLCKRFFQLKTSFLVSFQSANPRIQDEIVGGLVGYTAKRNRGLELLAEADFNKSSPTRLAICANPIIRPNFDGLFDIYVYARERNILPVNAALMVSGKQIDDCFLYNNDVSDEEKEALFLQIYEYNLAHGFSDIEQLQQEGISCMPGIHPCNQIAAGLYLTSNGNVIKCPGDFGRPLGNVHEQNIKEIWANHYNSWALFRKFNCWCPFKDSVTLPWGLHGRVLSNLGIKNHSGIRNQLLGGP